ncbi:hypothetical protein II906_00730, partial [bacterium]|nr:hypothetical protein [bacterium]
MYNNSGFFQINKDNMAKSRNVYINELNGDIRFKSSKTYNALYFKGVSYADAIDSINVNGNDIEIITKNNGYKVILTDYFKQNGSNYFKYIKTDEADKTGFLTHIINNSLVYNPNEISTYNKKKTATGTVFNDVINLKNYEVPLNGKGLTINSKSGNDTIYSSFGADTITGGNGYNKLIYNSADEANGDKIYLSKNENLEIDLSNVNSEDV